MAKAKKVKQLSFSLPNKVGQLAAVTELISGVKANIEAFNARAGGSSAEFQFVTESGAKVKKALASLGVEIREEEAVCVELANKPGRLQKVARKLAEAGVDIRTSWATSFSGKTSACVLTTSDNAKAIGAINKKNG